MEIIKKKCPKCDLTIEGTKQSQVDYNLSIHILQKHTKVSKANGKVQRD